MTDTCDTPGCDNPATNRYERRDTLDALRHDAEVLLKDVEAHLTKSLIDLTISGQLKWSLLNEVAVNTTFNNHSFSFIEGLGKFTLEVMRQGGRPGEFEPSRFRTANSDAVWRAIAGDVDMMPLTQSRHLANRYGLEYCESIEEFTAKLTARARKAQRL